MQKSRASFSFVLRSAAVLFIGGGGGGGAAALIPHSMSHWFRARTRPAPPTIKIKNKYLHILVVQIDRNIPIELPATLLCLRLRCVGTSLRKRRSLGIIVNLSFG